MGCPLWGHTEWDTTEVTQQQQQQQQQSLSLSSYFFNVFSSVSL